MLSDVESSPQQSVHSQLARMRPRRESRLGRSTRHSLACPFSTHTVCSTTAQDPKHYLLLKTRDIALPLARHHVRHRHLPPLPRRSTTTSPHRTKPTPPPLRSSAIPTYPTRPSRPILRVIIHSALRWAANKPSWPVVGPTIRPALLLLPVRLLRGTIGEPWPWHHAIERHPRLWWTITGRRRGAAVAKRRLLLLLMEDGRLKLLGWRLLIKDARSDERTFFLALALVVFVRSFVRGHAARAR